MNIVAVTACPTGVAHTNIAAKALDNIAKKSGHIIKIEKQGALGIQNKITEEEIEKADVVIFAVEQKVIEEERFLNKPIYRTSVVEPITNPTKVIKEAESLL